ncbi:MAG: hypothetical protein M3P32_02220 [Chloroflexota bacterium]|nr:hypothetical protein [Chloroflexota bacterium]
MSPRRFAAALLGAAAGLALLPQLTAAHALGGFFTLPVPLGLYLVAAGGAVAASFVVAVVLVRPARPVAQYPVQAISARLARSASLVLQLLGLAWWFGIIVIGLLVDPISPLPAVLVWIGIWVGLPITAVLLGNPWPSLSPFRTLFGGLERLAHLVGLSRLDAGLRYPRALGRWPATLLLLGAVYAELILPDRTTPGTIAALMTGYTLFTLLGMVLFGRIAWLRNAELFEVYLGWFGRVGPIGRRVVEPQVCEGCAEECDPAHCVDCPECAVAADPGERRAELRPWFTGLTEVGGAGWSDAAFILLALAAVTFDGLSETAPWGGVMTTLFTTLLPVVGPLHTVLAVQVIGLLALWIAFLAAFSVAAALTRRLHDPGVKPSPLGMIVGSYAATLLPIAGGYLIAHYLTLVIQGAVWIPTLIDDPLSTVAPTLDWIPISGVWYLSVGAIVIGHIAAVVLAHRRALRDSATRPIVAGLPLVLLMVGYTVLSLWIIAQPITLEPSTL